MMAEVRQDYARLLRETLLDHSQASIRTCSPRAQETRYELRTRLAIRNRACLARRAGDLCAQQAPLGSARDGPYAAGAECAARTQEQRLMTPQDVCERAGARDRAVRGRDNFTANAS